VDQKGFEEVDKHAQKAIKVIEQGYYAKATALWSQAQVAVWAQAGYIDFKNILKPIRSNGGRKG